MKVLHTSDWHLGQSFYGFDRTYEHDRFLDWLIETIVLEEVDILLIAGDVFDTANPSSAALRQFYRFIADARARRQGLSTVVIAGNHDSAGRLEAPLPLLESLGVSIVGQVHRTSKGAIDVERLVLPLQGVGGEILGWALAVPYLRPGDVPRSADDGDSFSVGVKSLYDQALDVAVSRRRPGQPILAMGHCHMAGGEVSEESERRIVIGGAEMLSASVFRESIAYAALGHLHLAQKVGGYEHIRYSGSPMPLSFSEVTYPHQVVLLDFRGEKLADTRSVRVPRAVEFLQIPDNGSASLSEVLALLRKLEVPEVQEHCFPFLEVAVRLHGPEPGLRKQVEEAIGDKPVRLVKLAAVREGKETLGEGAHALSLDAIQKLDPLAVCKEMYTREHGDELPEELESLFQQLVVAAEDEEEV